ncbi:hypothetical protein BHE82_02800 [Rice orange leaf phytoplasma]|nr:hypothetical protein [Rice orange leaf phytoplasma]OIJ44607.1 hypothetical protein BHE82_02800 [Rice orange leaf phytoplasma]
MPFSSKLTLRTMIPFFWAWQFSLITSSWGMQVCWTIFVALQVIAPFRTTKYLNKEVSSFKTLKPL